MGSQDDVGILVEAEAFDDYGGWTMDSQFESEMGSPYLLAHGNDRPVADATTKISTIKAGRYRVWVRAKDWVPFHHPGRFTLTINGETLKTVFGANNKDWHWQMGGAVDLNDGDAILVLHDLTGFCGRCDAIFLTRSNTIPPEVVGGGIPGSAAALTAARLGNRVALVQNRPYLGGNGSVEAGLRPRGITGPLVDEIAQRTATGDLFAKQLLDAERSATLFMEHTVYETVTTDDSRIVSIYARDARSGREISLSAPIFIDCSGKCVLGLLSGAETMMGQESKSEYGEQLAPLERNMEHHGNTLFFRTHMAEAPVSFPSVPWATEIAGDFSDLRGQLIKSGMDNGEGPTVVPPGHKPNPSIRRRMKQPMTHFWEYGQHLDPYTQGEHIRDHLLRAMYGTFSNVKTMEPEVYANLEFDWVAFVPTTGEYRRYKGDYVLTETDIREHKVFPDAVVKNGGAFCLHYPGDKKYDFRLKDWKWDERDSKDYEMPFRCFYSVDIPNLMMAGKHISSTHIAMSNTKFMGNGSQHAIATAAAAHLCRKYTTIPRGVYKDHIAELRAIVESITRMPIQSKL